MRLAVVVAALASVGCAPQTFRRTLSQQHRAAVAVSADCSDGYGSGTIISPTRVLTALHVVNCATDGSPVQVRDDQGTAVTMTVETVLEGSDVAVLVAPEPSFATPSIGAYKVPPVGEQVCIVAGAPVRKRTCGPVQFYRQSTPGEIHHEALTVPGNSGSGLYDSKGRLVGVVVQLQLCHFRGAYQMCGGYATGIYGIRNELKM